MSPLVKYDVRDVEPTSFEPLKPDVYDFAIDEGSMFGKSRNGNDMITLVLKVVKGDSEGRKVWHYILTDGSQDWRLRELTDALGLPPHGSFDPAKMVGTVLKGRTTVQEARDGYDASTKIKNLLPGVEATEDDEEEAPYSEWSLADLKEEAEAREIEVTGKVTKAKLVKALEESDVADEEAEDEEEGDEEDEDDEETLTRADLDEMSRTDLKALIKEEELEIKVLKKHSDDDIREMIANELEFGEGEEDDEDEEDEEEDDEAADYGTFSIADLKAEAKERGVSTTGSKATLIKRLEKDDQAGDSKDPF